MREAKLDSTLDAYNELIVEIAAEYADDDADREALTALNEAVAAGTAVLNVEPRDTRLDFEGKVSYFVHIST